VPLNARRTLVTAFAARYSNPGLHVAQLLVFMIPILPSPPTGVGFAAAAAPSTPTLHAHVVVLLGC
jgi:hypothetical protein